MLSPEIIRLRQQFLLREGDEQQALDNLWALYLQELDIVTYKSLLGLAEQLGQRKVWLQRVYSELNAQLAQQADKPYQKQLPHLIEIYLKEKELNKALALVDNNPVPEHSLYDVLAHLTRKPAKALPLYERLIRAQLKTANAKNYHEVINTLKDCKKLLTADKHFRDFKQLVGNIRLEHKAKRKLMAYLDEAFTE